MVDTVKLNLRLPVAMRQEAATLADAMGLSLNAYILQAVFNANGYRASQLKKYQRSGLLSLDLKSPISTQVTQAAPARVVPKVGSNQPCPCGSGQKYKRCHGQP